jgi:site-specific DNA-methyltransferase (adenine-specific)
MKNNLPGSPMLFKEEALNGEKMLIDPMLLKPEQPQLFYKHKHGELWAGDSIQWMSTLPTESVDLIFADPPYNIKKADWDDFESHQVYLDWSMLWIEEASRILKASGTLYICGFSEILADIKAPAMQFFKGCRWLVWHYKNKANLGNDWGRSHESILHFRKSRYCAIKSWCIFASNFLECH